MTPAERDKYVFLETLLCARERFVVSWVARDELTGEPIEPSPVVAQLVELLGRRYVDDGHALIRTFPLRRHDEPARGASASRGGARVGGLSCRRDAAKGDRA
ncbi:MAG: exodeoxyribonuclease V subunit gamma [Sandaracinus sp.]|nr:exodeoxyribonuclease V subunit gamma [Sandaracinus sp.]